jgi:molybdopterin/thiamine biosynthesis adenylyltransferase
MSIDFNQLYSRDPEPHALRGRTVLLVGAGAVGSNVATHLALMGLDVVVIDPELLMEANLPRTKADPSYVGISKGLAVAATIRGLVSVSQRIIGLGHDFLQMPEPDIQNVLGATDMIVAATGNDEADRRLNFLGRTRGIPLVVPSMWPQHPAVLADLLVVRWDRGQLPSGCFSCLHPWQPDEQPPLEAQRGLSADVGLVAAIAARTVVDILLPDTPHGQRLAQRERQGVGYYLIHRFQSGKIPIRNRRRDTCPGCTPNGLAIDSAPRDRAAGSRFLDTLEDWFRSLVAER